jgi:hypothetical protein
MNANEGENWFSPISSSKIQSSHNKFHKPTFSAPSSWDNAHVKSLHTRQKIKLNASLKGLIWTDVVGSNFLIGIITNYGVARPNKGHDFSEMEL